MFRQKSAKQTNAQTQASQANDRRSKVQQRRQRQRQRQLKNDLILNLRISREFEFIQFVYTFRNIPNRICKTASKFDWEILKIGRRTVHVFSNMQNVAFSRCCSVNFCKQRKTNEQRIITPAYIAIVLLAAVHPLPLKFAYNSTP